MSLDKAIKHGKDRRKAYRGAKAVSTMCRNLSCGHCARNEQYRKKRREPIAEYENTPSPQEQPK